MIQLNKIADIRTALREARQAGKRVGFVPTMGYLHEGHMSLVTEAKKTCDVVVMSIFVNPLQFGPNEDFDRYPRDIERDSRMAEAAGVDYLFTPSVEEMYPTKILTNVSVAEVSESLCGKSRPGHFDGVATVVSKLFHIVQPEYAYFGQKDAQQVAVIEQMVRDLSMAVEIVPCPILREADGLAMSSRNVYLSQEERQQALVLSRSLSIAQDMIASGERSAERICEQIVHLLAEQPLAVIDYVEIMKYPNLVPAIQLSSGDQVVVALAVKFSKTRLIDNLITHIP